MSLQDIVNVQITRETKAVSRAGFSTINILGINKAFTSLLKFYTKLSDVLEDFISTDPEYLAAQAVFGQSPSVTKVAISRRQTSDTVVCTVDTVANSTKYTCTINGTEFEFTSDVDATGPEIGAGLVAAINGGSEPVTATDNTDGTYDLVADSAGVAYSVKVDARQSMAFVTSQTPAEDLAEISEENDDWYGLVYADRTEADVLLIAAYVEGVRKVFGAGSDDSDIIDLTDSGDTDSIAAKFKSLAYARSFAFYHSAAASSYPEAAALGSILPLDPGAWTLKFKTLSGIAADVLSSTQRTNALAKNCNIHTEVGGVNIVENGSVGEGEWLDIIVFVDWLEARITENVYSLLVNQPKVPYTDSGIAAVEAEITRVLQQGVTVGGIAPDDGEGGASFTVTVPAAADVSPTDKANRVLNNVLFDALLAGAIHAVNIQGTVTV